MPKSPALLFVLLAVLLASVSAKNVRLAKGSQDRISAAATALNGGLLRNSASKSGQPRDIRLMSEAGYNWCSDWAGGSWCPEGYLCGDGRNGCDHDTCCQDENAISCPTDLDGGVLTPCSINSNPNGLASESYCCDINEICGDDTLCTNRCPKGECCEFSIEDAPATCYEQDEESPENECPEGVTEECCEAQWEFVDTDIMNLAWADFLGCNEPCFDVENVDINVEEGTLNSVCNYCLGSFEYICHREHGAICAMTVSFDANLDVFDTDENGEITADYSGVYHVILRDYECIAEECNTDENEDNLEELLLIDALVVFGDEEYSNVVVEYECSEIPHLGSYLDVDTDPLQICREDCACVDGEDFPVPRVA